MSTDTEIRPGLTALVLAASRKGVEDSVARIQNKSHKCLVETDGIAMLERVIQTLLDSGRFKQILVSIENAEVVKDLVTTQQWLKSGVIKLIPSSDNLVDSVIAVSQYSSQSFPLIITTADNVLHTPELIQDFVGTFEKSHSDVCVAVASESTVRQAYPEGKFGFFQFKDGGYSFCNLFGVKSAEGLKGAKIFRTGGQFRKHPWRMLRIFGIFSLLIYKWKLSDLGAFTTRISAKLGLKMETVLLNYPFAPIDVDNPTTFAFSQETLRARRQESKT